MWWNCTLSNLPFQSVILSRMVVCIFGIIINNISFILFQINGRPTQIQIRQLKNLFQRTGVLLYYIVNCYHGADSRSLKSDVRSIIKSVRIVLCQLKGRMDRDRSFRPIPQTFLDKVPRESINEHYRFSIAVLYRFIGNLNDTIFAFQSAHHNRRE